MDTASESFARSRWLLIVILAIYAGSMAIFYPDVISNVDEASYVAQAKAFASGEARRYWENPIEGLPSAYRPGDYPAGTSLLMAPFVALFGWQGVYLVPLLSLLGMVLLTARWMHHERKGFLLALAVLTYPATLVMGRVAMSDMPAGFLTTLAIVLFWIGADREDRRLWWISGFVAGATLAFRETGVLVIAPFYLGALLRRERGIHALVISGVLGVLVRPCLAWLVFGDPLYVKSFGYGFSLDVFVANALRYGLLTGIAVPGGLLAAILYRGRRWPEVVGATLLPLLFFSLYEYNGSESGWLKSTVLSGRFLIPVAPVLAFALAHAVPRWLDVLSPHLRIEGRRLRAVFDSVLVAGATIAAAAVHPTMQELSASHVEIQGAIYRNTTKDSWILTNERSTYKYLVTGLHEERRPISLRNLEATHYERILEATDELYLVLLERSESEFWRRENAEYTAFTAGLTDQADMDLRYDERTSDGQARLRVWRVSPKADPTP